MDEFDKALIEAQEQKSETWHDIRAGRFTSSEMHKLLGDPRSKEAKERGEWNDAAETYIHTKVAEQLTGLTHSVSNQGTGPLAWGEDNEPIAREYYQTQVLDILGLTVTKAGFTVYGDHAGGSPDGFVGDDALLEIKCPYNPANQIDYLKMKTVSDLKKLHPEYWTQCQSNLIFTKRKSGIFIAFDPRFKIRKQIMNELEFGIDNERQDLILTRLEKAIITKLEIVNSLS